MIILIALGILLLIILSLIAIAAKIFINKDNEIIIKEFNMEHENERIEYHKGDVLKAISEDPSEFSTKILLHICNNKGGWGAGFVLNLSKKWKQPELEYRNSFSKKTNCSLGDIQVVKIKDDLYIINLIAQNGYKTIDNPTPLSYEALDECLVKVMSWINKNDFYFPIVYCPKIGTGLAGGNWEIVKNILNDNLNEIPINVYEI